jgi:hypothetical protein
MIKRTILFQTRRAGIALLGVVVVLALAVPAFEFRAQPTLVALAQSSAIEIGDTVQVTTDGSRLNLRQAPGTSQPVVTQLEPGTVLTVIDGPQEADGYTWWKLQGEAGTGWAAGRYLEVVAAPSATPTAANLPPGSDCPPAAYPGLLYCRRDGGASHAIRIDLDDPHLRFETVIAQDQRSVNTNAREWVSEMARRHAKEGVVAAINADYFGAGHGPEGLTIVNGFRLDGSAKDDDDNNAVNRSAWVFSRPLIDGGGRSIAARVERLEQDSDFLDSQQFFNAVGGGPQVVFAGSWDWTRGRNHPLYRECPAEIPDSDVINGECFRGTGDWNDADKPWTVIGVDGDNQLLLLVTPYANVKANLEAYDIQQALKLDGGGSSQAWYNGDEIVPGGRPVADGLLVFYQYAYQVIEQSQWPVVVDGERATVRLSLRNTGADTWTPTVYALTSQDNPWKTSLQFPLGSEIGPGGVFNWEWTTDPLEGWGIKTLALQMVGNGVEFPQKAVRIAVVVLPAEIAEKKEELERLLRDWIARELEDIEQMVIDWIQEQLEQGLGDLFGCCTPSAALLPAAMGVYLRRRRGKGSWKDDKIK